MMNALEIAGQDYADALSFQKRVEALRRMTGEQRLMLAFEMWRTACQLTRDGIRAQFPNYSVAQVNQELARRIMISNGSARIISAHDQNTRTS
jgi:hypothetical protein